MMQKNSSLHGDKAKDRKDGITRASDAFITMMIGALVLLLWFHPSAFDKFWSELRKVAKPASALVEFLGTQPLVSSALQALPSIASTFVLLLFVLVLMFEHVRLAAPPPGVAREGAPLRVPGRIRLFSHRLGLVVVSLLAIFPGILLLLAEGYVLLPVVLIVPYVAIRVVAWVTSALFE